MNQMEEFLIQESDLKYLLRNPRRTLIEVMKAHKSETKMANLLAYFFRPNEDHGLGDLFLKAFFETQVLNYDRKGGMEETSDKLYPLLESEDFTNVKVETEVITKKGNRVDLLIYNDEFVICIEFKINHLLNNDLKDYEALDFIKSGFIKQEKQNEYFIILTPYNHTPEGKAKEYFAQNDNPKFKRMILNHFIQAIESRQKNRDLGTYLDEFLQTIENRAIYFRRNQFLNSLNIALQKDLHGEFIHHLSHGQFLEKKLNDSAIKIRVKDGELRLEEWNGKKHVRSYNWPITSNMTESINKLKSVLGDGRIKSNF